MSEQIETDTTDTWMSPPFLRLPVLKRSVFTPGQIYEFKSKSGKSNGLTTALHNTRVRIFIFERDEKGAGSVVHHIFRSRAAGWIETFTDAQCMDYHVREVAS